VGGTKVSATPVPRMQDAKELTSHWTTVSGGKIHALWNAGPASGYGPVVVLVPGMVVASGSMVPLATRLARLCRVFAIDLPGYGKSDKPWPILTVAQLADAIVGWMDANALPEAHFAGNSFGCQILAALAVRHPKRVNRLVLQGPTVDPAARGFWPQFWRQVRNGCIEHSALGRVMIRDYRAAGLRRVWATIQSVLADRIEEKLPQVQAPTLVMRGDKDVVVPQRWAEQVTQLLPHGKLCVVSSAAHTLNYTAPIEFIETIRPFFHL
jgi:2-hydroxy-6-oxonona-2,4-dienedioate hydrolase